MNGRSASTAFSFAAIVALSACLKRGSTMTGPSIDATADDGGGGGGGTTAVSVVFSPTGAGLVPDAMRLRGFGVSAGSSLAIDAKSTIVACLLSAGSRRLFFFLSSSMIAGSRDRLVIGHLEHVDVGDFDGVVIVVFVVIAALGEDRAKHVAPESTKRERRGSHATARGPDRGPDGSEHVTHAQRGRHDDRDDESDKPEQRRAGRADDRAQDLREMLSDRTAWTVTGDAIAAGGEMDERREGDHADRNTDANRPRHDRLAHEQRANRRHDREGDQEIAAHAGDPVEQAGAGAAERSHHESIRLQRDHRDEQKQRRTQPDHADHLAPPIALVAARRFFDFAIFGHGAPSLAGPPYPTPTDMSAQVFADTYHLDSPAVSGGESNDGTMVRWAREKLRWIRSRI